MSEYLASLARQAHRHAMLLSWVARKFQLQLHLTHPIVSPWAAPQSSNREPKQQPPFRVKEIAHLESLCDHANPYVRMLAMSNLMLAFASLRFAHLQRSSATHATEHFLFGYCTKDKVQKVGLRAGYQWLSPRLGLTELESTKLDSVSSYEPQPMSYKQFLTLSRELLTLHPLSLPATTAATATTYKGRRFLPTLASLLNVPLPERSSLGRWRERLEPQGATIQHNKAVRYDGQRTYVEGRT
eukprot:6481689-Amphidinium_carterae.1